MTAGEARRQAAALVEATAAGATLRWLLDQLDAGRSFEDATAEIDRSGPKALQLIDSATRKLAEALRPVRPFGARLADQAELLLHEMVDHAVAGGVFATEGTQGEVHAQAERVLQALVSKAEEAVYGRLIYRALPDRTISAAMAAVVTRLEQRRRSILRGFSDHVQKASTARLRLQ